jgi:hypothetical protein
MVILAGPCEQGTCPDYKAAFDLVYTFSAVPVPPLTIFSSNSDIRVDDCNNCQRTKASSSLGDTVAGGCLDFTSCGRAQIICVDPDKTRAYRIWKDKNAKKCYNLRVEDLGRVAALPSHALCYTLSVRRRATGKGISPLEEDAARNLYKILTTFNTEC